MVKVIPAISILFHPYIFKLMESLKRRNFQAVYKLIEQNNIAHSAEREHEEIARKKWVSPQPSCIAWPQSLDT